MRYARKADANQPDLVKRARDYGVLMVHIGATFDYIALWRGQFDIVEIKDPKKKGHADEFTPRQKEVMAEVVRRGGRILVWRTHHDVDRYVSPLH